MPKTTRSAPPKAQDFAQQWTKQFEQAVTQAAGKNGKLSMTEAKKLAKAAGAEHLFADDAMDLLKAGGGKSMKVADLVAQAKAYAERAAATAAGTDGRLSYADAAKLPESMVEDFFFIRKQGTAPAPAGGGSAADAKAPLEAATKDLFLTSETDAKFKFVSGPQLNGAPITADLVRSTLASQHDALMPDVMYLVDPSKEKLATLQPVEERSFSDFITPYTAPDSGEPQRYKDLKAALESQLTDIKVFRFGTIEISTFIVGRTKSGELAGLLTGQVET